MTPLDLLALAGAPPWLNLLSLRLDWSSVKRALDAARMERVR